jgi:hypothetical protein
VAERQLCSRLNWPLEDAVTTAADFRQYVQECIQSEREAATDAVSQQYLELAKLWLMAAKLAEGSGSKRTDGETQQRPTRPTTAPRGIAGQDE